MKCDAIKELMLDVAAGAGEATPAMNEHLRVSVGTPDDMARFVTVFKEIFPAKSRTTAAGVNE